MNKNKMEKILEEISEEKNKKYSGYFIQKKDEEVDEIAQYFDDSFLIGDNIYYLRTH